MDFEYIYRVSRFLHPFEASSLASYPNGEAPHGYKEFLTELGNGEICHGLRILTPTVANQYWLEINMAEYLTDVCSRWTNGLFTRSDVAGTRLIAKDDENDWFVTCKRHGNEIIHLPYYPNLEPRIIGGGIPGLISDFSRDRRFPFFDPTCSRRCRCFFNVREEFGPDGLERDLCSLWGSQRIEICFEQNTDPEYRYRELEIQALDAHLQMWYGEKVARNEALPLGTVCVAVTLDYQWVNEIVRFAEQVAVPGGSAPRVHRDMGMSCSHGAQGAKYPLSKGSS